MSNFKCGVDHIICLPLPLVVLWCMILHVGGTCICTQIEQALPNLGNERKNTHAHKKS